MGMDTNTVRAVVALGKLADLWQVRLDTDWTPEASAFPEAFPWAQVRLSLSALLPGMRDAGAWVARAVPEAGGTSPNVVTVVLAGNTPLLAWSPLCACLLSGASTVRVKLSRDETVWTRRFVDDLEAVAPEVAARIELYDFPGAGERTYALLTDADAVIAYGSDASVAALKTRTPDGVPFFGYGHAVSVGLITEYGSHHTFAAARGFARDVLMYNQQGCLSPHIIYALDAEKSGGRALSAAFGKTVSAWNLPPVTDAATAQTVREVRDVALFDGHTVYSDVALRWTVIVAREPLPYPAPVGHNVVYVSPVHETQTDTEVPMLAQLLKPVGGIVSCAGVSGRASDVHPFCFRSSLTDAGVSRICKPGEMQTPPLDWTNGNRDLLAELLRLPQ